MAIAPAKRGPTIREERPAAAAAASRWPRFDLREVHCTGVDPIQSARTAAPTYKMPIVIESTINRNVPRLDRPELSRYHALPGSNNHYR